MTQDEDINSVQLTMTWQSHKVNQANMWMKANHNATMFADCIFSEHQQSAEEGASYKL